MSLTVPPFSFHKIPEPREMADKLVCAIPEHERSEAGAILVDNILSLKLAGMAYHPRPERLVAVVYKELARVISAKPPNMRLPTLRLYAFEVYIQYMVREATNLAIARFMLDHPDADDKGIDAWLVPQVQELRSLPVADIADMAARSLEGLQQWRASMVESYPTEWPKVRASHHLVLTALESAMSGRFERSAGQLHQFLCEVGHETQEQ